MKRQGCSISDHDHKKKKLRKPRVKIDNGPNPPPPIPTVVKDMIERMGGTELRLIMQKGLYPTDLSTTHNRLSMPSTKCHGFPTLEFDEKNHVSLSMIDTKLKVWEEVSVSKWKMNEGIFVITGVWNKLAAANDLKVKDVIQIWCFKFAETGKHGFAMAKVKDPLTLYLQVQPTQDQNHVEDRLIVTDAGPIAAVSNGNVECLTEEGNTTESNLPRQSSTEVDSTGSALRHISPYVNDDEGIDLTLRLGRTVDKV